MEWISTAQACAELGLKPSKYARILESAGVRRVRVPSKDMRTWYITQEDLERVRAYLKTASIPATLARGKGKREAGKR